jgi:predicted Fe-S protein YdhL (DUF1289 family)
MESPCVKTCVLDPASRLCTGCGRSLNEIADWARLDDAERRKVMAELPSRMKNMRMKLFRRD